VACLLMYSGSWGVFRFFSVEGSDLKFRSTWNIKIMKCFSLTQIDLLLTDCEDIYVLKYSRHLK
jgi:hypothetical protein